MKIIMKIYKFFLWFIIFFMFSVAGQQVKASSISIGISPPYIQKDNLLVGSHYEQELVISRSNPNETVKAIITIDESSIKDWISFDPGVEISLPQGQQRVSINGIVDVPTDTKLGTYKTYARLSLQVKGVDGQISLVPAVRIDITITITDKKEGDIVIRQAEIRDFQPSEQFVMVVKAQNNGNIDDTFSRAVIDVFNLSGELVKTLDISEVEGVPPFSIKDVLLNFSEPGIDYGDYLAKLSVYKGDSVIYEDNLAFSVKKTNQQQEDEPGNPKKFSHSALFLITGVIFIMFFGSTAVFVYTKNRRRMNIQLKRAKARIKKKKHSVNKFKKKTERG